MNTRGHTRRQFLKNVGLGAAGTALLANFGLPSGLVRAGAAGSVRASTLGASAEQPSPDVELLCGDVTGFTLKSNAWEGAFGSVTFAMHRAFYNGDNAYYIRTDASDEAFAMENKLVFVPLLAAATAAEGATGQLYTFENGVDEQLPVVSTVPNQDDYSSAWNIHRVTFNGSAVLLDSADAIREAESAGDVTVEATSLVVNYPVVKWPDGELQEDTEKREYLGTGPLIAPVDTDNMLVTFKLHECYPGSRYIVTDTSAVPMAPMMSIAASGPTQRLAEVGATDEIWVFGNGIPGSGVMGFQPAIFDNAAGAPVWSPFWNHFTAVWTDPDSATVVTSSDELRSLAESGALEIFNGTPDTHPNGFVVNCPVPIKARNTFTA